MRRKFIFILPGRFFFQIGRASCRERVQLTATHATSAPICTIKVDLSEFFLEDLDLIPVRFFLDLSFSCLLSISDLCQQIFSQYSLVDESWSWNGWSCRPTESGTVKYLMCDDVCSSGSYNFKDLKIEKQVCLGWGKSRILPIRFIIIFQQQSTIY